MINISFFFPLEVSRETAQAIANEVGERCAVDPKCSVREGNVGWHLDVEATKIRESDKAKIYPFLYGVEFSIKNGLKPQCQHKNTRTVRESQWTGTVICNDCGYERDWGGY